MVSTLTNDAGETNDTAPGESSNSTEPASSEAYFSFTKALPDEETRSWIQEEFPDYREQQVVDLFRAGLYVDTVFGLGMPYVPYCSAELDYIKQAVDLMCKKSGSAAFGLSLTLNAIREAVAKKDLELYKSYKWN